MTNEEKENIKKSNEKKFDKLNSAVSDSLAELMVYFAKKFQFESTPKILSNVIQGVENAVFLDRDIKPKIKNFALLFMTKEQLDKPTKKKNILRG